MIQQTSFTKLCTDLNALNNQYDRGEIKHYDYMIKYDTILKNYGYSKLAFLEEFSKMTKKTFYAKKPTPKKKKPR